MMYTQQNVWKGIIIVFFCIVISLLFFGSLDIDTTAAHMVGMCSQEDDRSACYEREVPLLLNEVPLEEVFSIVHAIRKKDSSYQFCHVLAHKLGERIVAQDPARWLDAIPRNPSDGLCSNGFIHGVVGGKFRAEVLDDSTLEKFIPDFALACEPRTNWHPSQLDQATCYHGMGHLYMFITDADIQKALSLCERISLSATGDFRRLCRDGVFMQIYQPLEPDDFLMLERMKVKPTKETVRTYCASFQEDAYEGACLRESWPYVHAEILNEPGAINRFCAGQPNAEEENACYDTALSILGRQTLGNPENALTMCASVNEERRSECYARVALAYLEEDRGDFEHAIAFCKEVPDIYVDTCLTLLSQRAGFVFGSDMVLLRRFCRELPVPMQRFCTSSQTVQGPIPSVLHTQ